MPLHFWIIILVQFLFATILYIRSKMELIPVIKLILLSSIFGILFGFIFDNCFGYGIYTYNLTSPQGGFNGTGLTVSQLIINGAISFGIAVATVYFILPKKVKVKRFKYKKILVWALVAVSMISSVGLYFIPKSIVSLSLGGIAVVTVCEALLLLFNENGPFFQLFRTRKFLPFVTFWLNCVSIGLLYEIVNWFFPFWAWLPGTDYSHRLIESLVIIFGYVVIVHPMVTFWQLLQKSKSLHF